MTPEQKEWLTRPTVLPLCVRSSPEGSKWWEFTEEYRISLPPPHFPLTLVIPIGWRYDRSSVPSWVPGFIIDRDKLGTLSPAPHDAGFQCRGVFSHPANRPLNGNPRPFIVSSTGFPIFASFTRAEVDTWFLLYMLRQRIPSWRAYAAYRAVKVWWGFRELVGSSRRW